MADTGEELLDATGDVLARDGYADLTTKKVAGEVRVGLDAEPGRRLVGTSG